MYNGVISMREEKNHSEEFLHLPFKDLKKLLQTKKKKSNDNAKTSAMPEGDDLSRPPRGQPEEVSINDEKLFHDAMKEVQEIKEFRDIRVCRRETSLNRKYRQTSSDQEALKSLEELVKGRGTINLPDTQEYVEWINQEYREDVVKKLHKGQYAVQDCLDLHGIIIEEAEKEVDSFLKESIKKRYRCVKIIHGRGLRSVKGPVIKKALASWLLGRYRKKIIAFVTARQCDGGLGALYVLLR